jgi:hypothetical protein
MISKITRTDIAGRENVAFKHILGKIPKISTVR